MRAPIAAVVLLMLAPALASAANGVRPPQGFTVLRGPQAPTPPRTPAPAAAAAAAPASRSDFLMSPRPDIAPRFTWNAAPRLQGSCSAPDAGQCRQGCSRTYYFCLSSDDAQECSRAWTQCLASCASGSGGS